MGFMTGQKIYENFTNGTGPDGLSSGAAIVNEVAAGYAERAEAIRRITEKLEAAWQGEAAGAARRGVGPLQVELLAVRDGDLVWLKRTGRAALAETLAAQTADVPAGQGKAVMVSRAEVVGSVRGQRITEAAVRVGPASLAVRRVQQLVALPMTGNGELYAAVRDGVGRYRVSEPVRYADTRHGRYLGVTTGRDQMLVAPAGRADLVARLRDLHRSLAR